MIINVGINIPGTRNCNPNPPGSTIRKITTDVKPIGINNEITFLQARKTRINNKIISNQTMGI
jgi:hypothetical protein